MPSISAVAFDLDGLLVDTESLYQLGAAELLARRGLAPRPDVFHKMLGQTNDRALRMLIDECQLDVSLAELSKETKSLMGELFAQHLKPNPGVEEFLRAVETKSIPKGVVTNSQREMAESVLNLVSLIDRFEWITSSQDVPQGKPDPAIYCYAAERFEVDPADMLVLEDSEVGARAAVAAGAVVIAVPSEHTRGGDFAGCRFIADGLSDPRILEFL